MALAFRLSLLWLVLLAPPTTAVTCSRGPSQELMAQINHLRTAAGLPEVSSPSPLCEVAQWRAERIAETGATDAGIHTVNTIADRLRRLGYDAYSWREGVLVGRAKSGAALAEWQANGAQGFRETVLGDFEHAAVGVASGSEETVFTFLFALPTLTHQQRRVATLADLEAVRHEILEAVNTARGHDGRSAVRSDGRLDAVAQNHAQDMLERSYYSHLSPEGGDLRGRLRQGGIRGTAWAGENIARGLFTPAELVSRWLSSSGHRRNILRADARLTGLGVAFGVRDGQVMVLWCQIMATPPR